MLPGSSLLWVSDDGGLSSGPLFSPATGSGLSVFTSICRSGPNGVSQEGVQLQVWSPACFLFSSAAGSGCEGTLPL